jgi:hypothetical protein
MRSCGVAPAGRVVFPNRRMIIMSKPSDEQIQAEANKANLSGEQRSSESPQTPNKGKHLD